MFALACCLAIARRPEPTPLVLLLAGLGWLTQAAVEAATPSWLRPPPQLPPVALPFHPVALGMLALGLAPLSRRCPHPALVLVLFLSVLAGLPPRADELRPGQLLTAQQVASLTPAAGPRLRSPAIPELPATLTTEEQPSWLAYSNNPENIRRLEPSPLILFRETLPAGRGRLFASHFNTTGRSLKLLAELHNPDPGRTADLRLPESPVADPQELGTRTVWGMPERLLLQPGQRLRFALDLPFGNGRLIRDLESDSPVELTLAAATDGDVPLKGDVAVRKSSQSRGLFPAPDRLLRAEHRRGDGLRLLTLDRDWLESAEGERLAGNYGALTRVELALGEPCAVVLVPTGGWAATAGGVSLHAYEGLVLFNGPPGVFRYTHVLTTNSYAPVRLLIVPVSSR